MSHLLGFPVAILSSLRRISDSKRLNSKQFLIVPQVVDLMGVNFPGGNCPGGNYSRVTVRGATVLERFHGGGAIVRVVVVPGESYSGEIIRG